jgi:MFS transporter, FSR family, fosmidomycin resistance protein
MAHPTIADPHGLCRVCRESSLADTAAPAIRDTSFSLYFALAFGIGSIWSGILGWVIDRFGFDAAFYTMAASYVAAGLLLLLIRNPSPAVAGGE